MLKIRDVATVERAKKGEEYPKNATLIQVSATRGQIELHEGGEVESKYAVVFPKDPKRVKPEFLFLYLENWLYKNLEKIKTGLNIKPTEIEKIPFY